MKLSGKNSICSGSVMIGALVMILLLSIAIPQLLDIEIFTQRVDADNSRQKVNQVRAIELNNMFEAVIKAEGTSSGETSAFNALFPSTTESSAYCSRASMAYGSCEWMLDKRNLCPMEARTNSAPVASGDNRLVKVYACEGEATNGRGAKCFPSTTGSGSSSQPVASSDPQANTATTRIISCVYAARGSSAAAISIFSYLRDNADKFVRVREETY